MRIYIHANVMKISIYIYGYMRICVHTMESFEQLNIHNQNVIKFGLFKIQTLK